MSERLDYGFRLCTSRHASPGEIERLSRLHAEQASRLKARPDLADKIVRSVGKGLDQVELATLTVVANVLLNLDETINKE